MTLRGMAVPLLLVACGHAPQAPAPHIAATWQERDPIVRFSGERLPAESSDGKRLAVLMQGDIATSGDPWGALAIIEVTSGMELERVPLVGGDDWSHAGGQPLAARPEVERRLADANGRLAAWSWKPLSPVAAEHVQFQEPHLALEIRPGRRVERDLPLAKQPGCLHPARVEAVWAGDSTALVHLSFQGDVESRCGQPNDAWIAVPY